MHYMCSICKAIVRNIVLYIVAVQAKVELVPARVKGGRCSERRLPNSVRSDNGAGCLHAMHQPSWKRRSTHSTGHPSTTSVLHARGCFGLGKHTSEGEKFLPKQIILLAEIDRIHLMMLINLRLAAMDLRDSRRLGRPKINRYGHRIQYDLLYDALHGALDKCILCQRRRVHGHNGYT